MSVEREGGAVSALTRCLIIELVPRNPAVRVNAILPGPMTLPPGSTDEEKQAAHPRHTRQAGGQTGQHTQAVLSVVENDFVTGVRLPVDCGRTIHAAE